MNLPEFVNKHIEFFNFDQICYFCLICHVNSHYLSNIENTYGYFGNLNLIKEHIKIASFARGFKIDMESNFHKLLQVIDLAEFFNGGEM